MAELVFERVTKFYGPVIGINGVSCRLCGGIVGLLGANGAGKSTFMKLASGQLRPSLGEVRVAGRAATSAAARRRVGLSPDLHVFYEEMTGFQFVYAMARLHGYSRGEARQRTQRAIEAVGMSDRAGRRLAGASHGMRQRIKLAQAMVHDPELLLLDEPLSGIDPAGRREISLLLARWAGEGRTIVFSSHILAEVEQLADRILVLVRGRLVADGALAEVRGLLEDRPFVVALEAAEPRRLAACVAELPEVRSVEVQGETVLVRTRNPQRFFSWINELVVQEGLELRRMEMLDTGAEAVFSYLEAASA
jgi:ABC-2 type transport system ATP-binding protein